jgi:hypothetical protein
MMYVLIMGQLIPNWVIVAHTHNNGIMVTSLVFFTFPPSRCYSSYIHVGHRPNSISAMRPCVFKLTQPFFSFFYKTFISFFLLLQTIYHNSLHSLMTIQIFFKFLKFFFLIHNSCIFSWKKKFLFHVWINGNTDNCYRSDYLWDYCAK